MNFILAVISAIVLFHYGLQAFTREIQAVGGETLKNWLGRLTSNPLKGVLLGAIGTTLKGLLFTIGMKGKPRAVAVANICFNVIGVLLLVPFLRPFAAAMADLSHDPGMSVAWAQFLFNLGMTVIGLVLIRVLRDRLPDASGEAQAT